jgi:hypothetical protein
MTNYSPPPWLRITTSQVFLGLPLVGFFTDLAGSPQFKTYLAEVLTSLVQSFSTAMVHSVVQWIFYGSA